MRHSKGFQSSHSELKRRMGRKQTAFLKLRENSSLGSELSHSVGAKSTRLENLQWVLGLILSATVQQAFQYA